MPGGIHPPPQVIASWPAPNYENPETRGWSLTITTVVLASIALAVFLLRLWSRLFLTHNAGADDWVLLAAMVPSMGLAVACCLASREFYFGRHVWDVPIPELPKIRKITFAIELLYTASVGLIKISVLLFYKRLSAGILPRYFVFALWSSIAFVAAFMIVFIILPFAMCQPFSAWFYQTSPAWLAQHPKYHCVADASNLYSASIVAVIQDFLVAGMPTLLFSRLQIPMRQKFALGAVFVGGFFLCIAGIVRLVNIRIIFEETYDVTWAGYNGWLWTSIEVLLGIPIASAPALKVFFKRVLDTSMRRYYASEKRVRNTSTYGDDTAGSSLKRSRFSLRRVSWRLSGNPWERQDIAAGHGPDERPARVEPPAGFSYPLQPLHEEEDGRDGDAAYVNGAEEESGPPKSHLRSNYGSEKGLIRHKRDEDAESEVTTTTAADESANGPRNMGRDVALDRIGRLQAENNVGIGHAV